MPIINPWIFYLTELLTYIDTVLSVLIFIIITALIILIFAYYFDTTCCKDSYELKITKRWIKRGIIGLIIIVLFAGVIPSKKTIYQMLAANYVTYENVETASDIIKDSVDYIFEKLDEEEK